MSDVSELLADREYLTKRAIATLSFQINRRNAPGEYFSSDAEEIVDLIMRAVDCSIELALKENGVIE